MAPAYREFIADPRLRHAVVCYWAVTGRSRRRVTNRILPDGCFDLVFVMGGDVVHREADRLVGGHVVGPMLRPVTIELRDRATIVGVRFRPGHLSRFLRITLDRLLDLAVPGDALLGISFRELESRIGSAESVDQAIGFLEHHLLARVPSPPAGESAVVRAIRLLAAGSGRRPIAALAPELGISSRSLERLFRREVGYSPKELARVLRFREARARLEAEPATSLARLAADAGYADQAHLTREFREFAGLGPAAYRRPDSIGAEGGDGGFLQDPSDAGG